MPSNYCPPLTRPLTVALDAAGTVKVLETLDDATDYLSHKRIDPARMEAMSREFARAAQTGWPDDIAEATDRLEHYLRTERLL